MTTMSNYPSGFSGGVAIRGLPVLNTHGGHVFWVSSTDASAGDGTFVRPFRTIDQAVGACTAGRGDLILVKPNHAETLTAAAGIDADVAGITIMGLGNGDDMPTITFTTATTADVDIDADNIAIKGIRFVCGIDSQAALIDVNAKNFTLEGCEFLESSATGLTCVDINGGGANACDGFKILNNRFLCLTAANWDRAIELGEVAANGEISGNVIVGDFDDAGIHNPTGKVLTNLTVRGNIVRNDQSGQHAIELVSAVTGQAFDNRFVTDAQATSFDAGALSCAGNLWNVTTGGDSEGVPTNPAGDAATNFIGADNNNNGAATTNVVSNADGSVLERLEYLQAGNALGDVFYVKKTLTSSAVVQAGVDITGVSSGGDLWIDDIVLQTDATGLASGTNFTVGTNNTKGGAVNLSTAVSGLGANATIELSTASVTKLRGVVESGKKLIAKSTAADCTGGGTIDVYIKFRRMAAGATIAAA
jgi:hypothetical protein